MPNNRVTNEKCTFILEIDAEENRKLVDNMQEVFIIKVLKRTTADKKRMPHRSWKSIFKNKTI